MFEINLGGYSSFANVLMLVEGVDFIAVTPDLCKAGEGLD